MVDEIPAPEPTYPFGVDYAAYVALVGAGLIPAESWIRYAYDAAQELRAVSQGATGITEDADDLGYCTRALVTVAEYLYRADNAVSSEKIGPYAVTYEASSLPTRKGAAAQARKALAGSGLLYTGIEQSPMLLIDPSTGAVIGMTS